MIDPRDVILGSLPRLLGMELHEWSAGHAVMKLDLQQTHLNRHGLPHGGLYCSLLDTTMGYAGAWTGDPQNELMAMTLTLNTSFLSRPKGTQLIVTGRKTGGGRRTFFAEATLTCDQGEMVATGSGAFRYRTAG